MSANRRAKLHRGHLDRLQHSVPVETIRKALLRDSEGRASSPFGVALDYLA
jgi:hypothetical protein